MKPDVICPNCQHPLSAAILRKLWGVYTNSLRAVRGGGRPKIQTILNAVSEPDLDSASEPWKA